MDVWGLGLGLGHHFSVLVPLPNVVTFRESPFSLCHMEQKPLQKPRPEAGSH